MIIRYGVTGILLFFITLFTLATATGQNNIGQIKCICIDAGHGGRDPGAVGLKSHEKDIVLSIALKLGKLVRENYPGIKVVYTRDKDVFIDLDKRGQIANAHKADMFISLHINSNTSKTPHGIETYVLGLHRSEENLRVAMKENSVIKYEDDYSVKYAGFDPARAESYIIFSLMQNLYLGKSLQLAALVQDELVGTTEKTDRGVRQAGYLVLKDAAMPAILVEACFISNAAEERYLNTTAAQNKIAGAICQAIGKYKNSVEKNCTLLTNKREKEPENRDIEEREPENEVAQELFYAIQVASAIDKIKNAGNIAGGETVKELLTGGRYRYYVAESFDYEEVRKSLNGIKSKVRDCFIIAVHKGELIPVAEARKLEQR